MQPSQVRACPYDEQATADSPMRAMAWFMEVQPALRSLMSIAVWAMAALALLAIDRLTGPSVVLPGGVTLLQGLATIVALGCVAALLGLITKGLFACRGKPAVEATMLGRVYRLVACMAVALVVARAMGMLASFGAFFTLFGGMLLGWSLQAPISGFAAWVLICLKRPFRPGDRIQFPSLSLVGDVTAVGLLYTELNQVGGAIGSDEALGRHILIPNAMLFGQVVVNYTVVQQAAYMLDELVVRMTYDSDWDAAEKIMLAAAKEVTADVIAATGVKPYIRSQTYDYGVYLQLRYQTPVKERAEVAYRISKRVFRDIRTTSNVDLAIPYVYSYRAGLDRKANDTNGRGGSQEIDIDRIVADETAIDADDVAQVARSVVEHGLLQPVVVRPMGETGRFDLIAGHLRWAACRQLGRKTIPAIVKFPNGPMNDRDSSNLP